VTGSASAPASEPKPAAVLFDWDNTLVDSWAAIHRALAVTFEAMGLRPWSLAETKTKVRKSAREAFPELFGVRAQEAAEIFYDAFEREHLESLTPLPGAEPLLGALASVGYELGVVSNKRGRLLRAEAAALGWDRWLRRLVGANDAARDKPAPEVVDRALAGGAAAGLPRRRVWLVGDTDIDLQCAVNAGCVPILLRADPPAAGEFDSAPPERYLPDCAALQSLLAPG
jgi:phosphoglycolate phosphatase